MTDITKETSLFKADDVEDRTAYERRRFPGGECPDCSCDPEEHDVRLDRFGDWEAPCPGADDEWDMDLLRPYYRRMEGRVP